MVDVGGGSVVWLSGQCRAGDVFSLTVPTASRPTPRLFFKEGSSVTVFAATNVAGYRAVVQY